MVVALPGVVALFLFDRTPEETLIISKLVLLEVVAGVVAVFFWDAEEVGF